MEILVLIIPILFLAPIVFSIIAIVMASRNRDRMTNTAIQNVLERHEREIAVLEQELRCLREGIPVAPAVKQTAPPSKPEPFVPSESPEVIGPPPPIVAPIHFPEMPPRTPEPEKAAPPRPGIPRPAPAAPVRRPVKKQTFDWEALIGVKLFSWIAGVAMLLGAIFFLLYSIDRGWLKPPVRMSIGILAGVAILIVCELKAARKYPATANAMDASAIAILFSTFYAANTLWHLIDTVPDFLLLVLVTALAVFLSIHRDSPFIALLGLIGGFATPALLSTGENRPISLFGYLLLLNLGLAWVAARKKWPLLTTVSMVLTAIYQWAWVGKFLSEGQLPLAAGIFLVFAISGFAPVVFRRTKSDDPDSAQNETASAGAAMPLFFALYMAAVPGYGAHYVFLFSFLFLVAAGLYLVSLWRGPEILHTGGAASVLLVFSTWMATSYQSSAWPAILCFLTLFSMFYVCAPYLQGRRWFGKRFAGAGRKAAYAAPLLLLAFPALAVFEPQCTEWGLYFVPLLLILAACAAHAITERLSGVYFIAAVAAILAEFVWSHHWLTPGLLHAVVTVYVVFGIVYFLVPVAARRFGNGPAATEAVSAIGLITYVLLFEVALKWDLAFPPWAWLGALFLVSIAASVISLYWKSPLLHVAAVTASSFILIFWTGVSETAPWPETAIWASIALVLLSILWVWPARKAAISRESQAWPIAHTIWLSQLVAIVSSMRAASPSPELLITVHAGLVILSLVLAWRYGFHSIAVISVLPAAAAVFVWQALHSGMWGMQILFGATIYVAFSAYPLILGRRAARAAEPYLAAVLASAMFFFQARSAMLEGGMDEIIGILPVGLAAVTALLLVKLLRMERPDERNMGRLALVAATVLAFITVAIPLQLKNQWVTIGWALEGAALACLYRKIPHTGVLHASAALLTTAFARLAFNPNILNYAPRGNYPILNWYLYAYAVCAAALICAALQFRKTDDALLQSGIRASKVFPAQAAILLFWLLNIEIADFYSTGPIITFHFSATLAQDLTYTLGWALFAIGLLSAGVVLRGHATRISGILLMVATVLKCFAHDLSRLGGLYRVMSFVGLALCLALVAVVLQKYVLGARTQQGR